MKYNIFYGLLILLGLSCKKSSPVNPYQNSLIVGKWYVKTDSLLDYNQQNQVTRVVSDTTFSMKNEGYFYQFNTDGTAVVNRGYGDLLYGIFSVSGTTISITTPPVTVKSPGGTYVVNGLSETGNIESSTSDNLVLFFSTYETDANVSKVTGVAKVTEKIYFNK